MAFAFIALAVLSAALLVRARIQSRGSRAVERTLNTIGRSFFAIYRVDWRQGRYRTVKSAPDVDTALGDRGSYEHLLAVLSEHVHADTLEDFRRNLSLDNIKRSVQGGATETGGRYQREFPDGAHWVAVRVIFDPDMSGQEVIMCFSVIDGRMHEEIRRQELLQNALEAAQQASRRKSIFFSNISHDMRTPVNAIVGMSRLAREHANDPNQLDRDLGLLERAGDQLRMLVNDVLDISHIEYAEQTVLELAPTDLRECAQQCVEMVADQVERENKSIQLVSDIPALSVRADSRRLTQVLNNLISNSIKYSNAGAHIEVRLSTVGTPEERERRIRPYRIVVSDTGIGMSEEFLQRIFDPFEREAAFSSREVVGTGLGMPIVKSLVDQMGGEMTVESELGRGTTITLTIPFEVMGDAAPASQGEEQALPDSSPIPGDSAPSLQGMRVLVAEDNETNRIIVEALLEDLGVECELVANGQEAVDRVTESPEAFAAVLMDMQMPVLDGIEATRVLRARADPKVAAIPIIAVTANAFAKDIARANEAGMDGYVTKPLTREALGHALAEAASKHEANRWVAG